jgi:two-component system cell cycle sensor histidine kinase/response regulator CckA
MRNVLPTNRQPGLFWFVFENSTDAVVVPDARGDVALVNRAAREVPGVELGKRFALPGVSDAVLAQFRSDLRANGTAMLEVRSALPGAFASYFEIEGNIHDGYDVIVLRDVTERRKADEELRHLRRIDSLGYLTASVIHDFNNLMTPIVCMSALLERSITTPEPAVEMLGDIRTAAERAAGLVRQLLTFVRRDASHPAHVNLTEVVQEAVGLVRRVVGDAIDVELALASDLDDSLVDREQLEHVLLNLAANARDAMPRGGRLTVTTTNVPHGEAEGCSSAREYVALRVTDTGVGMSAEVKERLFERFFTTKEPGSGTGLGLATAHRFVTRSSGGISVRSEEGHGTTVVLYLPKAAAAARTSDPITAREELPRGSETILVVEDDEHVRRGMRAVLEELGYGVLDAPDGPAAMDRTDAHTGTIDLVLVDVVLSGIGTSGRALVDQLRSAGRSMKVLYMSGHTDKVIREHGVDEGVDALLRKAFSPSELSRTVREVLDGKRRAETSAA